MSHLANRVPRPLRCDDPLREVLTVLARAKAPLLGSDHTYPLDLDVLGPIEGTLGFYFADDLLAAFAVISGKLPSGCRFALDDVVGHCGQLREWRARGDLIGVAKQNERIWAIDKRSAAGDSTKLVPIEPTNRGGRGGGIDCGQPVSLASFLCAEAESAGIDLTSATASSMMALRVALHRKPPMADAVGRLVSHPTFGRGTAYTESGTGPTRKVKCDFPGVGLKVIQARFLTFHDHDA